MGITYRQTPTTTGAASQVEWTAGARDVRAIQVSNIPELGTGDSTEQHSTFPWFITHWTDSGILAEGLGDQRTTKEDQSVPRL